MSTNKTLFGLWQSFPSPVISRYLAKIGWDWVILDMQHSAFNAETAYECVHAIHDAGAKPVLRVPVGNPDDVQRALDWGASGIVVPMVNSVAEAKALARAAKYPPLGARSLGGDPPFHYGADYPERANAETLLLVQMEHIDAANRIEDILAVEGVDGCFIGPVDLALSMGLPRADYAKDAAHRAAIQRTADVCNALGKLPCCNCYSLEDAQSRIGQGYRCISMESDTAHFTRAMTALVQTVRGIKA